MKLSLWTKIGYALGDFGGSIAFQTVSLYVLFYFTDVFLIDPMAAGLIFFAAKIWNAVCDPLIGVFCDKTVSRFGSKRSFLLYYSIPLGLSFFLLFSSPTLGEIQKIVWALIAFLAFSTTYSLTGVPYGSLTVVMTEDSQERSVLTAYRMAFAILAILVVGGTTMPFVQSFKTQIEGFRAIGFVFGLVAIAMTLVTFLAVREKFPSVNQENFSWKGIFTTVFANKPFVVLVFSILVFMTGINILASMVNFYFIYNLNHKDWIPFAFGSLFVFSALALPLWLFISKNAGKTNSFIIGMAFLVVVLFFIFFLKDLSLVAVIVLFALAGIGMSTVYLFPWSMIPDAIDYWERETGFRNEGIFYGFFYFTFKASAALAGIVAGPGLKLGGYIANQTQSEATLLWMALLSTIVPAMLIVAGIFILKNYSIPEKEKS